MKINRRNLLKSGVLSIGGMAVAPYLRAGAFANAPLPLDAAGRIYYSPMVREYFLDEMPEFKSMIRIGANENPYGPPPSAREAIMKAVADGGGNRYSWQEMAVLVGNIAEKEGVAPENIMMGPGSSDLLEKTALVLCADGGNVVSADPTYMSLIRVAESVGASWKAIPCKADWSHDLAAMEKAVDRDTKLVYVCNPNNPVGSVTDTQALMDFCSRVSEKVPVFVDEAYLELAQGATGSMVSLLNKNKNVIIARTFSKIMGMAGLRVGYIAGLKPTLDQIQKITRGGMGISFTSIMAATAALGDTGFQEMTAAENRKVKDYLCSNLKAMGYDYIPSYTNFVIFPIEMNGKEFLKKMSDKGIAVRTFDILNKPWCRVSIGTMDEIKQFAGTLKGLA